MSPAPIAPEPPVPADATPGPARLRHFGAPCRRAVLAGALAVLWARAGRADESREAGEVVPPPLPVLRGRIGEPMRLPPDAPPASAFWGLGAEPGLAGGRQRPPVLTPREAGFGLYGACDLMGAVGAVVIAEAAPPPVDLDAVVVFSGDPSALRLNGAAAPLTLSAPPGARLRLRFANASPDALLALAAPPGAGIVAIDGQPCEMFAPHAGALPLAPSARCELMFDLADAPAEFTLDGRPVLRIVATGERSPARAPITPLPANPRLPAKIALETALRVKVAMSGDFAINGAQGGRKPLFTAKRGQPVVLTLTNQTPAAQTLRLEGHWARILHALDDGWDPYWRDVLYLEPGRRSLAAFVADNPGKWPLASASPARRAKGLAAWFEVG